MAKPQYDATHQRLRRSLLPGAYGRPCPFCGLVMLRGERLDLDHSVPVVYGGGGFGRMAHASCNRRMGAKIGAQRRWAAYRVAQRKVSRRW
jgi:hypothetical protein